MVINPGGDCTTLGIELITIAAVAKSPCVPPSIITSMFGIPIRYTPSLLLKRFPPCLLPSFTLQNFLGLLDPRKTGCRVYKILTISPTDS
jgi:hypothetical protein